MRVAENVREKLGRAEAMAYLCIVLWRQRREVSMDTAYNCQIVTNL